MSAHSNKKENKGLKSIASTLLNFIEHATDGIVLIQDRIIKYINESGAKLMGYSPREVMGISFEKFIHPDDLKRVTDTYEKRLKGEKVSSRYELKLEEKEGKISYVEVNADIVNYQGKPATISILRDITEKKKLIEEVKEKALFFESLFDNSSEAVALLDASGHVIKVNKEFEKMFGYTINEMGGQLLDPFVAQGDLLKEAEQIRKRTDKGEKIELETIRVKKDGSLFNVHITESPIKSGDKIVGKYVIYRDISARKKAEEKLKESERKYRELVEFADAGILIDDRNGHIIYANKRLAQIFGYQKISEFKKLTIQDFVHPEDIEMVLTYHQKRVSGKKAPHRYEFRGIRKDGKTVYLEVAASPLKTSEGIVGTRSYIWDISEHKRIEKRLEKSLKEKSVMLHEIHHRVKNNLQIIISLIRLQARRLKKSKLTEYLQILQDRVYSMSLIHDHFYKETHLDKINVASYIRDLVDHLFFIHNKKEKQIKIKLDLEKIYLDINKAIPFGMLVNEIITNILKHAFPGKKKGEFSIKLYREKNKKIWLLVNDNGVGIPKEVNIDNPSTMGLQLIRDLTNQIGGEIQIKSNGGTKITVIFPERNEVKGPEIRTQ